MQITKEAKTRTVCDIYRMMEMGKLSLEEIAKCVPSLSMEELKELKELEAEVFQLA